MRTRRLEGPAECPGAVAASPEDARGEPPQAPAARPADRRDGATLGALAADGALPRVNAGKAPSPDPCGSPGFGPQGLEPGDRFAGVEQHDPCLTRPAPAAHAQAIATATATAARTT